MHWLADPDYGQFLFLLSMVLYQCNIFYCYFWNIKSIVSCNYRSGIDTEFCFKSLMIYPNLSLFILGLGDRYLSEVKFNRRNIFAGCKTWFDNTYVNMFSCKLKRTIDYLLLDNYEATKIILISDLFNEINDYWRKLFNQC